MKLKVVFSDDSGLFLQRISSLLTKRQYLVKDVFYSFDDGILELTVEQCGCLPYKNLIHQIENLYEVISVETPDTDK